jgi:hypothetical protein
LAPGPVPPVANGRKITQSAELNLSAAPSRIDDVARELFVVVGQENGIVNRSNVTQSGGPDGGAQFQLSIPTANLPQTMSSLSRLAYARVVARTDSSQDVTGQYNRAVQRLADARALRTSLLKQLANATTTEQVDSLTARIHDAEASIASDQASLNGLKHQIAYSQVSVYIGSVAAPITQHHRTGRGAFTIGKAGHLAGRVLVVAAGVALIALAALAPVALLAALLWWIGTAVRRRRREQALDLA